MLLSRFIREGAAALGAIYPEMEASALMTALCSELLGTKSYSHILNPEEEIASDAFPRVQEALSRLLNGEPLQYITGVKEFYCRRFAVNPSVLIPRPETEILVREAALRLLNIEGSREALDLCTGSGCIAWSLALEVPGARITAVDISEDALATASGQSFPDEPEGWTAPVFVKADILESGAPDLFPAGNFDVLVSNPPYIRESEKAAMRRNVLDFEPSLALFVPDDDPLLFYRAVAAIGARALKPGGWGIVEINEELGDGVADVFRQAGFGKIEKIPDFFGKNRFVSFEKAHPEAAQG